MLITAIDFVIARVIQAIRNFTISLLAFALTTSTVLTHIFVCHLEMPVEHTRRLLDQIGVRPGPLITDIQQALSDVLLHRAILAYPVTPLSNDDPHLSNRAVRIETTRYQIDHASVLLLRPAPCKTFQTQNEVQVFLQHFHLDNAALCTLIREGDNKCNPPPHWDETRLRQMLTEQIIAGKMLITQHIVSAPPKPEPIIEAPTNDIGNRKADLGPHGGLHNQDWEGVEVKEHSFKTVKHVKMTELAEDEKVAARALKNQGWDRDKIEQVLSSGDDFTTKELKLGDSLYGFDTQGREKNIQNSAYWLDEAGYQDVKANYYKNGICDKEGVKNHLALPCYNRASDISKVEVTETTTVVQSRIGKARELIQYTDKSGYTTGMLGKIMPGGGTQITAKTAVLVKR